jgi:hypothetical protein
VNRDIWGIYEEVRVPFTSPTWNFPGFYSFEVDFAEREEWYSNNTSAVLPSGLFPAVPAQHSRYDAQKAEGICPVATVGSEVHRRVDAAWQLYGSLPCADTL